MKLEATKAPDIFGRTPQSYDTMMLIKEKLRHSIGGGNQKQAYAPYKTSIFLKTIVIIFGLILRIIGAAWPFDFL